MTNRKLVSFNDENVDSYSNDDLYNIMSWGADLSFRELINMYEDDDLMKPELQRNYVWDRKEASRFIESILLGLPVPSIFLAKLPNEKKLIIDGYQRILTVYGYIKGIFYRDKKVFKLFNSDLINERWRGKAYSELNDDDKRRIRTSTIHAIIFEQKTPKDDDTSLHQIFERINTGGRTLNAQEIRNCVSQGPLNLLLLELNKNQKWRNLYGSEKEDTRMRDLEFILRFFALSSKEIIKTDKKQISLKNMLDTFMQSKENNSEDKIEGFKNTFNNVIDKIYELYGDNAFNNYSVEENNYINKFHPTIYDSLMISTMNNIDKIENNVNYEERKIRLLQDEDYKIYISERTTNTEHIRGRIRIASNLLYGE
ncbi:DUF262 domain-containing protein [Clostridium sporogenes]|uniref:DUF262 domain-containing protein n=1 Tax=Clostridium sporogenes TaxID=1509 RepID=UPI00024BA03B|nr:DUF262 domain-containing protein [Clostridium sporogenes]EHN13431.1 hypothetical protein IYC_18050 [Clostridium sporogenes PA 3679]MDU4596910.1 DUF262 domain-containing protein [Clostridium sporogenes]NFQ33520.1 DUF262 domain-containing protein [Clostridium sporogenes]NFQ59065.1 DUF262 domain-containing protein [Clostridium sporogenes]NFU09113.1 DUF262 domain-containing protein [Clostridium sporogenes]